MDAAIGHEDTDVISCAQRRRVSFEHRLLCVRSIKQRRLRIQRPHCRLDQRRSTLEPAVRSLGTAKWSCIERHCLSDDSCVLFRRLLNLRSELHVHRRHDRWWRNLARAELTARCFRPIDRRTPSTSEAPVCAAPVAALMTGAVVSWLSTMSRDSVAAVSRHPRAEREGFEPSDPVTQVNSLAVSPIRPLSHLSVPGQRCICLPSGQLGATSSRCPHAEPGGRSTRSGGGRDGPSIRQRARYGAQTGVRGSRVTANSRRVHQMFGSLSSSARADAPWTGRDGRRVDPGEAITRGSGQRSGLTDGCGRRRPSVSLSSCGWSTRSLANCVVGWERRCRRDLHQAQSEASS
jgi:hypothetical protein